MKKAPSTILATAGLTVGMLGFALPASAATAAPSPHHPITLPTGFPTTHPAGLPDAGGSGGKGGDPGKGGKPVYHPTPTCHPQPKPPVKPLEYDKHSNKNKGYMTALYSWQHPKSALTARLH